MDIQLILYLYAFLSSDPEKYSAAGAEFLFAKNEKGKTVFNGKTYTNKVTVKQVLTASKVTVKKTAKKFTLKAKLKINGKLVKGKTVTFKFNGKTYKVKTNKKGIAQKTLKKNVIKKRKKYRILYHIVPKNTSFFNIYFQKKRKIFMHIKFKRRN